MEQYLQFLINEKNQALWDELNSNYSISLHKSDENNYKCRTNGDNFEIHIYVDDLNPEAFTHELLHLYIKSKGFNIPRDLSTHIIMDDNASSIFSENLLGHAANILEHVKMLEVFINMGFDKSKFLSDFNEHKLNGRELKHLKDLYKKNGEYCIETVDFYIGKFLAIKSDNNKKHKYYEILTEMKKLDGKLFQILNDFWKDWETFDIDNPEDSYEEIFEIFIDDISDWMSNKSFFRIS